MSHTAFVLEDRFCLAYAKDMGGIMTQRLQSSDKQAVRIPKDMALPNDKTGPRKEDDRPAPPHPASLTALLETLTPLEERFPVIEDPVPEPVDP